MATVTEVSAQKGLHFKFSIGPGYTSEYSELNESGLSIVTKNHAIGWGITNNFAVLAGEFGGLTKLRVNDYEYINLDAFGLGFSYRMPNNINISALGAYSKVSLAKEWSQSFGDDGGRGYGINMSIDKEWFIAKKWGVRVGPQVFWLKTTDTNYQFFNLSMNGSVVYYLSPIK